MAPKNWKIIEERETIRKQNRNELLRPFRMELQKNWLVTSCFVLKYHLKMHIVFNFVSAVYYYVS